MKNAQYTFTMFTPSEAEQITGVTTTMQRDWRRHGYLPSKDGHARFDAFELAEMLAIKLLSDRGIGPQNSKEVAPWCAGGIMHQALKCSEAYEGDHDRTWEWNKPALAAMARCAEKRWLKIREDNPALDAAITESGVEPNHFWGSKAGWLSQQIMNLKGFSIIPAEYFIWWADGSHSWHHSIDKAFQDGTSDDPRFTGPVVVLDQRSLASLIEDRAGRAFVHIEFSTDPDTGEILAPMEYGTPIPIEVLPEASSDNIEDRD